jgi:putative membrane protein
LIKEEAKMMHWGNFGGMGYGGFGFGWIFMILFWALVILGIIYIAKQLLGGNKPTAGKESAEDILKKKYAAGEITKDEFKEKLTAISK